LKFLIDLSEKEIGQLRKKMSPKDTPPQRVIKKIITTYRIEKEKEKNE